MKTLHRTHSLSHPTPAAPQTQGWVPRGSFVLTPESECPGGAASPALSPAATASFSSYGTIPTEKSPIPLQTAPPSPRLQQKGAVLPGQAVKTSGLCRKINFLLHAVVDFEINPGQGLSPAPSKGSCCTALLHQECTATPAPLELRQP